MPPTKVRGNVAKVLQALEQNPQLLKELNTVFTKAYAKAGVNLTQAEKGAMFRQIGSLTEKAGAVVAWI